MAKKKSSGNSDSKNQHCIKTKRKSMVDLWEGTLSDPGRGPLFTEMFRPELEQKELPCPMKGYGKYRETTPTRRWDCPAWAKRSGESTARMPVSVLSWIARKRVENGVPVERKKDVFLWVGGQTA